MIFGLWLAALMLIAATLLPFLPSERWWIRIFDFPRLQLAVLLVPVIVAFAIVQRPLMAPDMLCILAMVGSLGYQLYQIFPYTPLARADVRQANDRDPKRSIRLLVANVLMHNRNVDHLLKMIRLHDPDLVLIIEADDWWDRQLSGLEARYSFVVRYPLQNTYGMHLFSKLDLRSPTVSFMVEEDVPSIHTAVRLRSGDWIEFHGVHPRPPKLLRDTTKRDAELVLIGRMVRDRDRPVIIAGDFNDVAWSHTTRLFQRLSGTLDPRVGRGMFNTFHAGIPFLRWPLDNVFNGKEFALGQIKRLDHFGSDHFPIFIEFFFEHKRQQP
jgi:endonuclease/exonuclease/phosphatase (EEP) superfamily protein YafD